MRCATTCVLRSTPCTAVGLAALGSGTDDVQLDPRLEVGHRRRLVEAVEVGRSGDFLLHHLKEQRRRAHDRLDEDDLHEDVPTSFCRRAADESQVLRAVEWLQEQQQRSNRMVQAVSIVVILVGMILIPVVVLALGKVTLSAQR